MAFDYGKAFGLAGDLLSGIGDYQAGQAGARASMGNAARSREAAALSSRSNALQLMRLRQSAAVQLGGQQTDIAASGLTEGSALDVVRQSQRNAALDAALLKQQGQITESGYLGQAEAYDAQAQAQKKKSSGGFFGSLLKIGVGAVTGFATGGPAGGIAGAIGGLI